MRNESVQFNHPVTPELGSELEYRGRPVVVMSTRDVREGDQILYCEVRGSYGHSKNGLITGLTCAELAFDGMDGHEWESFTSIHHEFEIEHCRWCGETRETNRLVNSQKRAQAQAEIAALQGILRASDEPREVDWGK